MRFGALFNLDGVPVEGLYSQLGSFPENIWLATVRNEMLGWTASCLIQQGCYEFFKDVY